MEIIRSDFYCRFAIETDLEEIARIHADAVQNGDCGFDDQTDVAQLIHHYRGLMRKQMPFLVAASPGRLLGYAHGANYHPGAGFAHCLHTSVWTRAAHRRGGVGTELLRALLAAARQASFRQALGWVMQDNAAALALLRTLGFTVMGWHRDACLSGGRLRDVILLSHDLWRRGDPLDPRSAIRTVAPEPAEALAAHA
jgi:L-amino acid N-acyltransferase YncA